MTTQEPAGLDELWAAYDQWSQRYFYHRKPEDGHRTEEARTALITAIEARAVAPWREALRRYVTYNETFGEEKLREEFGPPQFDGSSMSMEAWLDRVLRDPARALLHPDAEVKDA